MRRRGRVAPPGLGELAFDPETDLVFDYEPSLPGHANGLVLKAFDAAGNLHLQETYYSIGGGFVVTERGTGGVAGGEQKARGRLARSRSAPPRRCCAWAAARPKSSRR